ncbi:MAG TPA: MarR family transcriptional regulator [Actinoplanes sp.]
MARVPAARRRSMNTDELAVWRSLLDTTTELRRRLATQLADDSQLSPGDYAVLLALSEADGRRRSSELAASMDWERSRLSHHLGRMEKRGLIAREDCATDNRGAEVLMTEAGAAAFNAATLPHMRAIKRHFADALTPEQFDALSDALRSINQHLG